MKVGMIGVWDKWGTRYATTVLQLDDCRVVQVKTEETDGYTSVQLGVGEAKQKRVRKHMWNHLKKWGDIPTGKRQLGEFRVTKDQLLEPGTVIQAMHFVPGQVSGPLAHMLSTLLPPMLSGCNRFLHLCR